MATFVIACAALGAWRYFRIKAVLGQKVPPPHFGRTSIRPLVALLLLLALVTASAVYAEQWHRHNS